MRLAVISPQYPEYSINYATAMSSRCEVLTCLDNEQLMAEYAGRTIPSGGIQELYRMRFKSAFDLIRLIARLVRYQPTVVHFQEAVGFRRGAFNAVIATIVKQFAKVALTIHDPVPHSGRDVAASKRAAWSRNYVRRLAHVVVLHGDYCAAQYRAICRNTQQMIVVGDHGVVLMPSKFIPPPLAETIKLYVFGRMEAYKGLGVLLDAVRILHDEGVPFELLIEGRGVELVNLQNRFEFFSEVTVVNGFVQSDQIIRMIRWSDCVVMPYLNATQSGVLAGAFAGGRFVIASAVGGIADIVIHQENGLLVPPGNPVALAAAIRRAASDILLRRRLCEGAQRCAMTKLRWERIADVLMHHFIQVAR